MVAGRLAVGPLGGRSESAREFHTGQRRSLSGAGIYRSWRTHWDPYARGAIIGITRDTSAAHIARAALEGAAYQVADLIDAMHADTGKRLKELRVDGGASHSAFMMQFQADLLQIPVVRPAVTETTALGAAYLAGLAVGYWKDIDSLSKQWQVEKERSVTQSRWTAASTDGQ